MQGSVDDHFDIRPRRSRRRSGRVGAVGIGRAAELSAVNGAEVQVLPDRRARYLAGPSGPEPQEAGFSPSGDLRELQPAGASMPELQDLTSTVTLFRPGPLHEEDRKPAAKRSATEWSLGSASRWANGDIAPSLTGSVVDAILGGGRAGGWPPAIGRRAVGR